MVRPVPQAIRASQAAPSDPVIPASEPSLQAILLEDDPLDAELIEQELRRSGFRVQYHRATNATEFIELLQQSPPDLVLADHTLPGYDGITALRQFRELYPDVPFIFVSGSLGEERAIEALKRGATDYVLKDRLPRLPAVVQRALEEHESRTARQRVQNELEAHRQLLTAIIDNLPEHIYAVDASSRLTVINRAMLSKLKQTRAAAIGLRLTEIPNQDNARSMELQDAMVLNSGSAILDQESVAEYADGSVHWLISSRIPLRNQLGELIGVVCTERDHTARKELEQAILDISDREQRRLGSDLHDGLGQELTGLSLMMKGLEVQMLRSQSDFLPQVVKLNELIARTIQSTRSLARGLAPVNLERGGIREALKQLAARCTDTYNLICTLDDDLPDSVMLDEGLATHIYRIAQEATTNAARHAHAQHIRIELHTSHRRLHLSISDDGIGLKKTAPADVAGSIDGLNAPAGLGLKIMEYRARTIGGHISFDQLKPGTRIALSCPLQLLKKRAGRSGERGASARK